MSSLSFIHLCSSSEFHVWKRGKFPSTSGHSQNFVTGVSRSLSVLITGFIRKKQGEVFGIAGVPFVFLKEWNSMKKNEIQWPHPSQMSSVLFTSQTQELTSCVYKVWCFSFALIKIKLTDYCFQNCQEMILSVLKDNLLHIMAWTGKYTNQ